MQLRDAGCGMRLVAAVPAVGGSRLLCIQPVLQRQRNRLLLDTVLPDLANSYRFCNFLKGKCRPNFDW